MADRASIQQQLAEKRAKLAQLRSQRQATASGAAPNPAPAPTGAESETVSATPSPPVVSPVPPSEPAVSARDTLARADAALAAVESLVGPVDAGTTNQASAATAAPTQVRRPQLKMSDTLAELSIPPKTVELFTKHTQTQDSGVATAEQAAKPATSTAMSEQSPPATAAPAAAAIDAAAVTLSAQQRRAIEQSADFTEFVQHSARMVGSLLGIQLGDAAGAGASAPTHADSAEPLAVLGRLHDIEHCRGRAVSAIACCSNPSNRVAVAYVSRSQPAADSGVVLVWTLADGTAAAADSQRPLLLECESSVMSLCFVGRKLVGGLFGGQVVLWDTDQARVTSTRPLFSTSASSENHVYPILCTVQCGSSRTGPAAVTADGHVATASADGTLCSWVVDGSRLERSDRAAVLRAAGGSRVPLSAVAFRHSAFDFLLVGTENGELADTARAEWTRGQPVRDFVLKRVYGIPVPDAAAHTGAAPPADGTQPKPSGAAAAATQPAAGGPSNATSGGGSNGHRGMVTAVSIRAGRGDKRELVATASLDWTVCVWEVGRHTETPVYVIDTERDAVTDVQWSPTHPSLLASTDAAGVLALYQLAAGDKQPSAHTVVVQGVGADGADSGEPPALTCVRWLGDGSRLLVGDSRGHVHLVAVGSKFLVAEQEQPAQDGPRPLVAEAQ